MSIFSRLKTWAMPKNAVTPMDGVLRGTDIFDAFTGGASGAPSENEAMAVTAVYACVNLISGAIAALPMHVYRRANDGDLQRDANNELWWILNEQFCPRWSASTAWSFVMASKLLHGDGFAEILRAPRSGRILGLVPIHPIRVRVIATPDGSRLVYEVQPDPTIVSPSSESARVRVIDQDDMLHFAGFGFNGLRGMSALRNSLRTSGRLAISAQDFSNSFLQNAGRPDFALKTPNNLTDEKFQQLQAALDKHRSPANSGRPIILEGGLDIETITMPIEDMQLVETRKFQIEEIARAFNVPPFMIGHTENSTSWGTGIEAMGAGFVRYALRDHMNGVHNEINRKFFRTPDFCAEFDTAELERGDFKSMVEAVRIAMGRAGEPPIMSTEEGRSMLRLPRKMSGTVPTIAPAAGGQP
jgi:HK97 family phage portal protein